VNLQEGEQHAPEYLAISPGGKIPAIIDHDGPGGEELPIFESGAILLYLAEKSGRLLPADPRGRWQALEWLMFQMGGVGPMLGQAGYFRNRAPEAIPSVIERFTSEAGHLYGVVDRRLADREFLADDYSIADIACFPWLRVFERLGIDIGDFPAVSRWLGAIAARPAVQRGLAVL
ncbi:MAG: glutathione S-transferase N-terminal domain-containing protein, partial [Acidobacteria bacterium]|nr:glutathione S-transferase N-terminal domain-containing protein [Acidobacteriota bacterium]